MEKKLSNFENEKGEVLSFDDSKISLDKIDDFELTNRTVTNPQSIREVPDLNSPQKEPDIFNKVAENFLGNLQFQMNLLMSKEIIQLRNQK